MNTLIFDCDGVLADTERYGHLPAFNQAFTEFGLPVRWSEHDYAVKLRISGGKERLASLLTDEFLARLNLPRDTERLKAEVARWHRRKTEIYTQRISTGQLPPRPGVRRLIGEAIADGWQLAVASTSTLESVQAVLKIAAGPEAGRFRVFAGDVVTRKKPAPDIYELALRQMGADPGRTLVIEDSENGLEAARGAGLDCVVTVNGYTEHEHFDAALLVLSHLGEGDSPLRVLENQSPVQLDGELHASHLLACLPANRTARRQPRGAGVA